MPKVSHAIIKPTQSKGLPIKVGEKVESITRSSDIRTIEYIDVTDYATFISLKDKNGISNVYGAKIFIDRFRHISK